MKVSFLMLRSPLALYKVKATFFYLAAYSIFYIYPNLFPLQPPSHLPMYSIDYQVPFLPWTFLVYLSDYLIFVLAITLHPSLSSFRNFERLSYLVLITCGTFFLLYPTAYPRPNYPIDVNPVTLLAMTIVHLADTPNNCFPSMHVAFTGTATWSLRKVCPQAYPLFIVWSLAIFASTLTTKQHYFIDVAGGLWVIAFVAIVNRSFFERNGEFSTPRPAN